MPSPTQLLRIAALLTLLAAAAPAQLSERPGNSGDNPIDRPRDLSGHSIKNPRLRIVHTADASLPGGSMWLQQRDPWLAYAWGRSLFQREFRAQDGVFGEAGKLDGARLPDGATHIASRGHVNSCAVCHNSPYRDAGAGSTIAKNGGSGRNTPHLFGAGLTEMIGQQLRLQILEIGDDNRDGWISLAEARGKRCRIAPQPGAPALDFGRFDDRDRDGRPDLNEVVYPIFVDADGKRIAFADGLGFGGVAGYRIEVQVFGFGHRYTPNRPPLPSTLRAFNAATLDTHMGLQPCDGTTLDDPDGDGFARVSNAGVLQPSSQAGRDRGRTRGPNGIISRDDPDRDGYCEEISEGELDVFEWFSLNHPRPARGQLTPDVLAGQALLKSARCTSCHVADWRLLPAHPDSPDPHRRYAGDRRFFDLDVAYDEADARLEGRLVQIQAGAPAEVAGIYSDFRYHDLGDDFAQLQFDGTLVRKWRTTPLWGVANSAPYGHDGASLTLDSAIRRHGGEAAKSRDRYLALTPTQRQQLLRFLDSLILYQTDQLPADIDADGHIDAHFQVAGQDTGTERLNPEWLFRTPGKIEGPLVNLHGDQITSFALTNVESAYGLDLELLRDRDHDTFPDAIDPQPRQPGFHDGTE